MKPICVKIDGCSYGEYLKVVGTMVADLGGVLSWYCTFDRYNTSNYVLIDKNGWVVDRSISEGMTDSDFTGYELMTPQQLYDYAESEVTDRMVLEMEDS